MKAKRPFGVRVKGKDLLDRIAELEGMLSTCEDAINSLDEDALGYANDGDHEWPNRDELLSNIERVLSNARPDAPGEKGST